MMRIIPGDARTEENRLGSATLDVLALCKPTNFLISIDDTERLVLQFNPRRVIAAGRLQTHLGDPISRGTGRSQSFLEIGEAS